MEPLLTHTITTPDGPFSIIEDSNHTDNHTGNQASPVLASGWTEDISKLLHQAKLSADQEFRASDADSAAVEAVAAYYDGHFAAIDHVPVRQNGTQLQQAVWQQLRVISPGFPLTYAQLAQKIGRPRAFRAVASCCARNANALFVPCHRVVAGDGTLAGFAWGTETKSRLLQRESDPQA